ncbi:crossover junction endodeoxyribonuclease RuvC [Lentisphaera profundi]|uniref:Crossover junction endodeoxyribonuclease RuvC n=1 Tax=Lentisphaera profundi TaxID=1658616 RepID=A0ABY7VXJ7_9BACT|nr:crossover junction endodeoxyribonuclease RuvC [Lentisphaera profundi]WDE98524.1 crossover junction endodeoxyribonuclease RuvC [Lentisphaera profundi]
MGVDTSLRSTGYGVVDLFADGSMNVIDCGIIKNKAKLSQLDCLKRLHLAVTQLLDLYKPDHISIEGTFYSKFAKTAMILGMARGSVLSALAGTELPVWEYAPKRAKQAITGSGNSSKEQVATMIAGILKADISQINDDATDALALAVCHGQALISPLSNKMGLKL